MRPHLPRPTLSVVLLAVAVAVGSLSASVAEAKRKDARPSAKKVADGTVQVTWLGHAAFEVISPKGTTVLIDPFLSQNPKTPKAFKDLKRFSPDVILVSHSHGDHVGDAVAIAKRAGAKVVGAYDHVGAMKGLPKKLVSGGNVGGTFRFNDVTVHLVPAMHGSSPGGRPVGFVLSFDDGQSLYHSGDTWIFSDMALIQELYHPDILLLQAGGGPYNQAPDVAALAVKKYFSPTTIIPMHFGTFGALASADDVDRAFAKDARYHRLNPGETRRFKAGTKKAPGTK